MTIFTATLRKILGDKPWEVEDHAPALFSTENKAIDYVKHMLGNGAYVCDNGMGYFEEWTSPFRTDIHYIIEERTVDTQ